MADQRSSSVVTFSRRRTENATQENQDPCPSDTVSMPYLPALSSSTSYATAPSVLTPLAEAPAPGDNIVSSTADSGPPVKGRRRRMAPSQGRATAACHAHQVAELNAYFREVDAFELAVETPTPKKGHHPRVPTDKLENAAGSRLREESRGCPEADGVEQPYAEEQHPRPQQVAASSTKLRPMSLGLSRRSSMVALPRGYPSARKPGRPSGLRPSGVGVETSEAEPPDGGLGGLAGYGPARVSFGLDRRGSAVADNMATVGGSNPRRSSHMVLEALAESPDQPAADHRQQQAQAQHVQHGVAPPAAGLPRRHSAAVPSARRGSVSGKVLSRLSLGLSDALQWLGLRGALPAAHPANCSAHRPAGGSQEGRPSLDAQAPVRVPPHERGGAIADMSPISEEPEPACSRCSPSRPTPANPAIEGSRPDQEAQPCGGEPSGAPSDAVGVIPDTRSVRVSSRRPAGGSKAQPSTQAAGTDTPEGVQAAEGRSSRHSAVSSSCAPSPAEAQAGLGGACQLAPAGNARGGVLDAEVAQLQQQLQTVLDLSEGGGGAEREGGVGAGEEERGGELGAGAAAGAEEGVTEGEEDSEDLPPLQQLLLMCGQELDEGSMPSMDALLGQHVDLAKVKKIGEGTFGEAFKAGGVVFKIVPMEGDVLVNGEVQKRAAEILAEAAITLTLSRLRGPDTGDASAAQPASVTAGFVETYGVGVCKGWYAGPLLREWHRWDQEHESENDPVDVFGPDQLFVVFVVADGGLDLEHFELRSFKELRSILLQVCLTLAAAEEGCEFEHRDLHWGNLLIQRDASKEVKCRLRGCDVKARTGGVTVTLIDFTLSRLVSAGGEALYCDLAADPDIFKGPKGDVQAETYRRMKKATKGRWGGFHPATNCLWMHYLADICLNQKLPGGGGVSGEERHELRSFRKRALGYASCAELLWDEFFAGEFLVAQE